MSSDVKVYDRKILGARKSRSKLYLVHWYYMANYDFYMAWADNEEQAKEFCNYAHSPKVQFLVAKSDPYNMPVMYNFKEVA
jgi:imidazoleglycerol phosphate synthase glutamine amidotransferase subunit HisH